MRIAYVEDNPTNLALVERVAGMNRHAVVSYAEGEIAAEELLHERFDLILMDVELAGEMGGLQVVRTLRQAGVKTPIIAVTAYAMLGDRERCLEAGCDGYLPKPLPIAELLVLLAKYDAETRVQPAPAVAAEPVGAPAAAAPPAPGAPVVPSTPEPAKLPVANAPAAPTMKIVPSAAPTKAPEPTVNVAPSNAPLPPAAPTPVKPPEPTANAVPPGAPVALVPSTPESKPEPTTNAQPGSDKSAQSPVTTPDRHTP